MFIAAHHIREKMVRYSILHPDPELSLGRGFLFPSVIYSGVSVGVASSWNPKDW